MNKKETIEKIAELSGIPENDCRKVLESFEKILEHELSASHGIKSFLNTLNKLLSHLNNR